MHSNLYFHTGEKKENLLTQHQNKEFAQGVFRIPSVTYENAGIYECEADNGIMPAINTNFTIIIRGMKTLFSTLVRMLNIFFEVLYFVSKVMLRSQYEDEEVSKMYRNVHARAFILTCC